MKKSSIQNNPLENPLNTKRSHPNSKVKGIMPLYGAPQRIIRVDLYLGTLIGVLLLLHSCTTDHHENESVSNGFFPFFIKKDNLNPILGPSTSSKFSDPLSGQIVNWEERNVLNPTAVVRNDTIYLLYRAQDSMGTSRIGLAKSTDGMNFKKQTYPVFYPNSDDMMPFEWNYKKLIHKDATTEKCTSCYYDGVEDPRIIEKEDGTYFMTYTSYDGKTARLSIASSRDLVNWTKHGLVLNGDIYKEFWSKVGAIVGEQIKNKIIAKKINGKYWMYFGDTNIFMAHSTDMINWDVATNAENGKMISVLHPRMGYFDSRLVEPGPYALLKEEGILLIYNGSNAANYHSPRLPKYTYSAGQALFQKDMPYKLIDRTTDYLLSPDKDYELIGEVNDVCFVEGLVFYKEKWFLYYGTADSKIAVAVYDPASNKN